MHAEVVLIASVSHKRDDFGSKASINLRRADLPIASLEVSEKQMKIEFTPKNIKLTRIAIALVAISLAGYVAYAATQLTMQNNSSVSIPITNLFADTTGVTATTNCATASGYTDTGLAINWVAVPQGATVNANICLKNTGTGTDTLNFVASQLPTGVPFSTTSQDASLASGASINVQLKLAATSTAASGQFSFTLTIS